MSPEDIAEGRMLVEESRMAHKHTIVPQPVDTAAMQWLWNHAAELLDAAEAQDALIAERDESGNAGPGSWLSERDQWCARVAKRDPGDELSRFCWLQAAWQESMEWAIRRIGKAML